eukprot:45208-Ditylum_brightwellii.AAC.2
MGYHYFDQLLYTDHKGIYIDVDTELLFGTDHVKLVQENCYLIRTKDPHCESKCNNVLHKHLDENNFWTLMIKLMKADIGDHQLTERLDKILIQACLIAKKKHKQCYSEWWLLLLIRARSMIHKLKVHLAKLKCNANIDSEVTKFGITIQCPENIPDIQKDLRKAQQSVKIS